MEIILRAEAVEQAQAGDKCDFTGTLIVVPDVAQLSTPGKNKKTTVSEMSHCALRYRVETMIEFIFAFKQIESHFQYQ